MLAWSERRTRLWDAAAGYSPELARCGDGGRHAGWRCSATGRQRGSPSGNAGGDLFRGTRSQAGGVNASTRFFYTTSTTEYAKRRGFARLFSPRLVLNTRLMCGNSVAHHSSLFAQRVHFELTCTYIRKHCNQLLSYE